MPESRARCARSKNNARSRDRKSTRLNSSHSQISYAVFCLKKKKNALREAALLNLHSIPFKSHFFTTTPDSPPSPLLYRNKVHSQILFRSQVKHHVQSSQHT